MKDQQDHLRRRSTTTWLERVAAITLSATRTGAPIIAVARGKIGLDLTFVKSVAA